MVYLLYRGTRRERSPKLTSSSILDRGTPLTGATDVRNTWGGYIRHTHAWAASAPLFTSITSLSLHSRPRVAHETRNSFYAEVSNVTFEPGASGEMLANNPTRARFPIPPPPPASKHTQGAEVRPPHKSVVLSSMKLTLHATRRTPHGASRLVHAMPARSVKTRQAPFRHCGDARDDGYAWNEYTPPPPAGVGVG